MFEYTYYKYVDFIRDKKRNCQLKKDYNFLLLSFRIWPDSKFFSCINMRENNIGICII